MTWLLKLYPPRWRRRYGDEFVELVGAERFSIGTTIDIIAGAIDAWRNTQSIVRASGEKGERDMIAKALRFRFAGCGSAITGPDQWKSVGVVLGGTLVLTVGWMWLHIRVGDNPYVDSLSVLPFLGALLVSTRYTYLKGRSAATQAVFIGVGLVLLAASLLGVGWICSLL